MLQVNSQLTTKIQNHSIFANFYPKTAHFSNRSFVNPPKSKSFVCIKCDSLIDPPYNTGNDFVYEDDFSQGCEEYLANSGQYDEQGNRLHKNQETNGRFHTDWLNMMYPRLKIARDLLSDDGVIFISIDDNEQANLKKICDEIFGVKNLYGTFIQLKGNTQNDSKSIQKNHEYILCYTKNYNELLLTYYNEVKHEVFEGNYYLGRDTGASSGHDKLIERVNLGYTVYYIESTISGATGNHNKLIERVKEFNKKYGEYGYYVSKDGKTLKHAIAISDYDISKVQDNSKEEDVYTDIEELSRGGYKIIRPPKRKAGKLGCWTWSIEKFKEYWNNNEVVIKNYRNIIHKEFVNEKDIYKIKDRYYYNTKNILPLKSIIEITNSKGSTELKGDNGLIPGVNFNNPKSTDLLKFLISAYKNTNNFCMLDFFSGSATTADAIMQLNAEDGGNRKFIMVQLPEVVQVNETQDNEYKTICDIGEERIRRAGKKIKEENPNATNLDIGFRVLRLDSSNMNDVYYNAKETTQSLFDSTINNVKADRTPLDLLFQVMLELGVELSCKIEEKEIKGKKYFVVNENDIVAFFDEGITNEIITELAKIKPLYAVFCDGAFETDSVNINTEQIFKSISPSTTIKVL